VPKKETTRYGIIDGHNEKPGVKRVETFIEKPTVDKAPSNQAAIGRYIVTPELMKVLSKMKPNKKSELRLADAIQKYITAHPIYATTHKGTRYDCGDKLGFLKATVELGLQHPELRTPFRSFLKKVSS
jgi:UTP--glucose-1-phosphate uridylyltransferase